MIQKFHTVICDKCGQKIISSWEKLSMVISTFRDKGWTLGKKHICPDCVKKGGE